jgi:hypothetical protein
MGHHDVVEAAHQPESAPVAGWAPGQTARAAPQGGDQPPQRAIPACHTGRRERRAEWSPASRRPKAAGTAQPSPPADLHPPPRRGTDLDDLGGKEMRWGAPPGLGLPPPLPPPSTTRDNPHNLEPRCARGFPAIREQDGACPHAGDDRRHQRGGLLLRARADVDPQQTPTPHRQGGMAPRHLARTQLGRRCIPRHAGHVHLAPTLAMMRLRAPGSDVLQAMHRFAIHGTNVGGPCLTDTPPLTLQQPYARVFGELAASPQGAVPFRELPVACRTAQPFDGLVRPSPRPRRDVACAGTIEACAWWIRARKSRLALWGWRRCYHSGPPLSGMGPKDIDSTPVFPCYYSPGLPFFTVWSFFLPL